MTQNEFQEYIAKYAETIEAIKQSAHQLHDHVNQTYDKTHPYGFHLDMVVDSVYQYGHEVCDDEHDVLPLFFGAYYHDSIEDARLTYNDVKAHALRYMDEEQALMAAEIAYALTNDKGRNRAERAGEVMGFQFSSEQKLMVNEELKRRGLPPIEDDDPDDLSAGLRDDQVTGRPVLPNFEAGDAQSDLENRQKKFGMMMKPFQL